VGLTIPSVDQLSDFWGDEAPDFGPRSDSQPPPTYTSEQAKNRARAAFLLGASENLLELATGYTDDPTDSRYAQLFQWAIMDFTIYEWANRETIAENYNAFTGERIGSYSYTKKSSVRALAGSMPDVEFWNIVVEAATTGDLAPALETSTCVFSRRFHEVNFNESLIHDPSMFQATDDVLMFDPFATDSGF
jgi:hypothetical protein